MVFNPEQKLTADPKPEDATTAADILESLRTEFKERYKDPSMVPPEKVKFALGQLGKLSALYEDTQKKVKPEKTFEGLHGRIEKVITLANGDFMALTDNGSLEFLARGEEKIQIIDIKSLNLSGKITQMAVNNQGQLIFGLSNGCLVFCDSMIPASSLLKKQTEKCVGNGSINWIEQNIKDESEYFVVMGEGDVIRVNTNQGKIIHDQCIETLGVKIKFLQQRLNKDTKNLSLLMATEYSVSELYILSPNTAGLKETLNFHENEGLIGLFCGKEPDVFFSIDKTGLLISNDIVTEKEKKTQLDISLTAVACHEGEYLFCGTEEGTIICLKLDCDENNHYEYKELTTFPAHDQEVGKLELITQNGKVKLVSSDKNGLIKIWDIQEIIKK